MTQAGVENVNNMKVLFKSAKIVDFTGTITEFKGDKFKHLNSFDSGFMELIRNNPQAAKAIVIIDRGFSLSDNLKKPVLVQDHLNLSGDNPLVGPNHPAGERFPVVQNIYYTENSFDFAPGVVAGLKQDIKPNEAECAFLRKLNIKSYCYNLVPAMLIASHACWKVLGIVLPEGVRLTENQIIEINKLVG